mmetsp:Transcript_50059/g.76119  ORF Transcript_50059/g.76119 Transcript_50059/m.76119 type:complete len:109 (-) Transcript_50059:297-623(-)
MLNFFLLSLADFVFQAENALITRITIQNVGTRSTTTTTFIVGTFFPGSQNYGNALQIVTEFFFSNLFFLLILPHGIDLLQGSRGEPRNGSRAFQAGPLRGELDAFPVG